MPARSPYLALQEHKELLQDVVSCVSRAVVVEKNARSADAVQDLTLSEEPALLQDGVPLGFALLQQCQIVESAEANRRWDAHVAAYEYRLIGAGNRELCAYHWHPGGESLVTAPHLHVGRGFAVGGDVIPTLHFPTAFVPLPDVLQMAITDLGVRPRRRDWARVFDAARRPAP